MANYKILRWDPVVFGDNVNLFPMIYIKPNQEFIDFAKQNGNSVFVKIDGTNTIYDGKAMVGIVSPSAELPCTPNKSGCAIQKDTSIRPHFFEKTGLYTITLYARWYEYPIQLGTATITGLKGPYKAPPAVPPPYKPPVPIQEFYDNPSPCKSMSLAQIGGVGLTFMVLFIVLFGVSIAKNRSQY